MYGRGADGERAAQLMLCDGPEREGERSAARPQGFTGFKRGSGETGSVLGGRLDGRDDDQGNVAEGNSTEHAPIEVLDRGRRDRGRTRTSQRSRCVPGYATLRSEERRVGKSSKSRCEPEA